MQKLDLDLELEYIFIPSKVPSQKLMIILHGRGDSSEGFVGLPRYLNMEDMNYILFDAPFEYYSGFSWYQLPPDQLPGIEYSSAVLTRDLDTLFMKMFDAKQSVLFGFSQGSLLTFEFGARYHKVLAGYVGVSGYIYDTEKLLEDINPEVKNAPWLCTHGVYDEVLNCEISKEQVKILQDGGMPITFKEYEKDHSIVEPELEMLSTWLKSLFS